MSLLQTAEAVRCLGHSASLRGARVERSEALGETAHGVLFLRIERSVV